MTANREQILTQAFVSIANSLVERFDVVDLLSRLTADCARLLDIASAGLLLADERGELHVVAASSEGTRNLELFQLQREQGPCLDCFHSGIPVSVSDLSQETARWPQFTEAAIGAGFTSVHALPMRLRDTILGTLGLFGTHIGPLNDEDRDLGQALAHVASIAIIADKAATNKTVINEQLQTALTSRIVLEQAKGLLAQLGNFDMEQAFIVLRRYARDHNLRLTDIAHALVARELAPDQLIEHALSKEQLVSLLDESVVES